VRSWRQDHSPPAALEDTHEPTVLRQRPTGDDRPGTASNSASGPGPVVVLVPGLGLDSRSWRLVRKAIDSPSFVVLLPSMGQRAPRGCGLSVECQATRLIAGLPERAPVVLVGHSASCPVVVEAARRTAQVVGLVLVGPVTDPAAPTWPRMLEQWARTAAHERFSEAAVLGPQYRRTGPLSMVRSMDTIRHFRTDVALIGMDLPVEIVRGQHDRIASREWSSALRAVCHGRLTTVHGAAHMVPLTHPNAVATAVLRAGRAATAT
jgi:pimeloyl-ACP methyl ester carboxylesterase